MGMLYGQAEEILYKYPDRGDYVSQLLWDMKPLVYMGLGMEFGLRNPFRANGFNSAFTLKFGFPLKTGIMEDRDWLYQDNEKLTNYSRHDAYSQNAILFDLSTGYSWRLTDFVSVGACSEFSFMYFSWMAEGGYKQYLKSDGSGKIIPGQTWTDDIPKISIYGPGIRYTQAYLIAAPGIYLRAVMYPGFSAKLSFNYSPLIYVMARDDHLSPDEYYRGKIFWDLLPFGHYFNGGASLGYTFHNNLNLSLSVSYRYITGLRGKSYVAFTGEKENGIASMNKYDGGAGYSALEIGLFARIYIRHH
jgi:outer membrane protease